MSKGRLRSPKDVEDGPRRSGPDFATRKDLERLRKIIMTAIEALRDYAAKQEVFNGRLETSLDGVKGDVDEMKRLILELQTSSGPISEADQATLTALEAKGEALATRLEAVDDLTPPVPPV